MNDLNISDVRVFVPARDFALSKAFYSALGWTEQWTSDDLALLEVAGQRFYLQNYYNKDWAENFMMHISVENAQDCYLRVRKVMDSGQFPGTRIKAPEQQPYGALVAHAWDPSGVLLHFCEWI